MGFMVDYGDFVWLRCVWVQLSDLPDIDYVLITQSLDDHCHLKTLRPLAEMKPDLRVVATPNAKSLLDPLFRNVSVVSISWACFL